MLIYKDWIKVKIGNVKIYVNDLSTLFTVKYDMHINTKIKDISITLTTKITSKKGNDDINSKTNSSDDNHDNKDNNGYDNRKETTATTIVATTQQLKWLSRQ